ncbi:acid sphingomyelinase, putative [Cordyceps militaris CM01]|uniref:Acid sphingomyelinase, putative n=1 Tax=Cordyceps militaris (strain CM01) TaxID=983644 RepID=G3JCK6_CORMM|nr:acid sphingomyelinase, putative [Cordyceps militaris CM01]EGX93818.1 acid sphingomyelinase, putative [Cordyceps militaris CM01]
MRLRCSALLLLGGVLQSVIPVQGQQPLKHDVLQRSLEAGTWAVQTRDMFELKTVIKGLVADSDEPLISIGKTLCLASTSYDEEFCAGTIEREVPALAALARNVEPNSTAAIQFCITFLGVCEYPKVDEWAVPFPSKPFCDAKAPAPSSKKPLKVVHYSDIHVDPLYVAGTSTECKKPICCRQFSKDDEPGNATSLSGPYGDHNCGVPASLELSMYKAIEKLVPDQAFTIFTGDIVDHMISNTSKQYNLNEIDDAYNKMNDSFKLVYGTIGNHEVHPVNIFEPKSVGNASQWVYDAVAKKWAAWIGDAAKQQVLDTGAYSTLYPGGNLRVISLNTNMYYRFNFAVYGHNMPRDPNGQLAWLVAELDKAEQAGENVYIIGHMPMGTSDALPDQANYFDQVVQRYATTIRALFFGHTHDDHFEVSYSDYAKRDAQHATAMSYICPSLIPTAGMPAFRIYDVDPDTFAILDAVTYIADMSDPAFQTSGPVWKEYYSARASYGPLLSPPVAAGAELGPSFWHNVTAAFASNATLFGEYVSRKSRGWRAKPCDGACRDDEICQLRAGRSQDNCHKIKPGATFGKRDGGLPPRRAKCDDPVMADMLRLLATRQDLLEELQAGFVARRATIMPWKPEESVMRARSAVSLGSRDDEATCVERGSTTSGSASGTAASPSATSPSQSSALTLQLSVVLLTITTLTAILCMC